MLPTRDAPPARLHGAMHDAVFPGGRRARPLLCRLVADATAAATTRWSAAWPPPSSWCTAPRWCRTICPASTTPQMRRGLPACHVVYGQATAILVGDALLTLAFETLANAPVRRAPVAFRLMGLLTAADRQLARRHRRPGARARAAPRRARASITAKRRRRCSARRRPAARSAAAPKPTSRAGRASASSSAARCSCATTSKTSAASTAKSASRPVATPRSAAPTRRCRRASTRVSEARRRHRRACASSWARRRRRTEALHRLVEEVTRPQFAELAERRLQRRQLQPARQPIGERLFVLLVAPGVGVLLRHLGHARARNAPFVA